MSAWVLVLYLNSSGSALLAIDMPNRASFELELIRLIDGDEEE